ncbi:hypothetical protein GC098_37720 [Paenibacillus sp. LMG 31458]|uniref:SLH domain-containing protein n=1 Tax=Paenibacillus phytorum TaxID=2654977 RepID=A0ABX1Y8A9_9BACL|nr:S-layer homology domain-containing protein [Paenibacillus phytorum]NOU77036.1 hypothetical protein [Paenibacillus phytorum]
MKHLRIKHYFLLAMISISVYFSIGCQVITAEENKAQPVLFQSDDFELEWRLTASELGVKLDYQYQGFYQENLGQFSIPLTTKTGQTYIVGHAFTDNATNCIIALNQKGDRNWYYCPPTNGIWMGRHIKMDLEGNLYFLTQTNEDDVYLVNSLDTNGQIRWSKSLLLPGSTGFWINGNSDLLLYSDSDIVTLSSETGEIIRESGHQKSIRSSDYTYRNGLLVSHELSEDRTSTLVAYDDEGKEIFRVLSPVTGFVDSIQILNNQNVFLAWRTNNTNNSQTFNALFNSNGGLVWKRALDWNSFSPYYFTDGIDIYSGSENEHFYRINGSNGEESVIKMPYTSSLNWKGYFYIGKNKSINNPGSYLESQFGDNLSKNEDSFLYKLGNESVVLDNSLQSQGILNFDNPSIYSNSLAKYLETTCHIDPQQVRISIISFHYGEIYLYVRDNNGDLTKTELIKLHLRYFDSLGHWAENSMRRLINEKILTGYEDGSLQPDSLVTREQYVTMLIKALHESTSATQGIFKDVSKTRWSNPYIQKAYELGILDLNNGYFKPDEYLSRLDMAILAAKALHLEAKSTLDQFKDLKEVPKEQQKWVDAAAELKFISGFEDNTFRPRGTATRAQVSVVIEKILNFKMKDTKIAQEYDDDYKKPNVFASDNDSFIGSIRDSVDTDYYKWINNSNEDKKVYIYLNEIGDTHSRLQLFVGIGSNTGRTGNYAQLYYHTARQGYEVTVAPGAILTATVKMQREAELSTNEKYQIEITNQPPN